MGIKLFDDEMEVSMKTALGISLGTMIMPKKMRKGLIKAYLESRAVKSTYLYIDGKEIT
ncbi:unnamed protein product, partial [marine sediment metagenome]